MERFTFQREVLVGTQIKTRISGGKMKNTIVVITVLLGQLAYGHGENKPGPHKGYVKMPGAFHTEVVPNGASKFKIYLLDINWKNPSLKDSKLDIKVLHRDKAGNVECSPKHEYFQCQLPDSFSLKMGKLVVNATRENATGVEVSYSLPLSFKEDSDTEMQHSNHNGHH